jgi:hypothetical protein
MNAQPGYVRALLDGLAMRCAEAGLGVYDAEGYAAGTAWAIFAGPDMPADFPTALGVALATELDTVTHDAADVRVQFRARTDGDAGDAADLQDGLRDVFHGARGRSYLNLATGVHISSMSRTSIAPAWRDENRRLNITAEYRVTGARFVHPV